MADKNIYVVTNPERGWDCVCGVYSAESEDKVYKYFASEHYGKDDITDEDIERIKSTYVVHVTWGITPL
jgi:hypothetical protein